MMKIRITSVTGRRWRRVLRRSARCRAPRKEADLTAFRGFFAGLLFATILLAGCAAHHTGAADEALKLQTTDSHAGVAAPLPGDVWPGAAPAGQAARPTPPAANAAPLGPKYETDAAPASRQYRIDGANAVRRLPNAGKPAKPKAPPPTYSIEPSR